MSKDPIDPTDKRKVEIDPIKFDAMLKEASDERGNLSMEKLEENIERNLASLPGASNAIKEKYKARVNRRQKTLSPWKTLTIVSVVLLLIGIAINLAGK
jgi:hypothetical protein